MTCSLGLSRFPIEASNPRIFGPTRSKLWKFFRMQSSRENFKTIHYARAWSREVRAGIHHINFAVTRRGKRIEIGKLSKQFVISPRATDIVAAECKNDDLRTRLQHLLPLDLRRRLMFAA